MVAGLCMCVRSDLQDPLPDWMWGHARVLALTAGRVAGRLWSDGKAVGGVAWALLVPCYRCSKSPRIWWLETTGSSLTIREVGNVARVSVG